MKHQQIIKQARKDYKDGRVISEKELFKRLEKDANRTITTGLTPFYYWRA